MVERVVDTPPGNTSYTQVTPADTTPETPTFTYFPFTDGAHDFYTRVRDTAGNLEPAPTSPDTRTVVDTVAASMAVLPMRFPAVVEEQGIVEELLAPHHDRFVAALGELEGRVQYTLKGRYEQDVVLREVLEEHPEIAELQAEIRDLPEDATYHQRLRLGELVVGALEERRDAEAARLVQRLEPYVVGVVSHDPGQPDDVFNTAFLVERGRAKEFEDAVEQLGEELHGRARLRLLGPLAPYDFVPADELAGDER